MYPLSGANFWVHAFNHDRAYCAYSETCNNSVDLTWLDGTKINYDSSNFNLKWPHANDYCAHIYRSNPRANSILHGEGCHSTEYFMCTAPCDDQSEYNQYNQGYPGWLKSTEIFDILSQSTNFFCIFCVNCKYSTQLRRNILLFILDIPDKIPTWPIVVLLLKFLDGGNGQFPIHENWKSLGMSVVIRGEFSINLLSLLLVLLTRFLNPLGSIGSKMPKESFETNL